MRINLTKKQIVNSIYMQIGFSKKISESLLEDVFQIILKNLISNKKVKIAKFGTFSLRNKNERIGRNPKTKEVKIISGDIRDHDFLINHSKKIDAILHLAALIGIPYSYHAPKSYIETNVIGTYNVLNASKINNISIHNSTN